MLLRRLVRALPPWLRARLTSQECDPLSCCARSAHEVLRLVQADLADAPDGLLREAAQAAVLRELDHEGLLTEYRCSALALLTLQEATRRAPSHEPASPRAETLLLALDRLDEHLRTAYALEPPAAVRGELLLLVLKHQGRGVEYLRRRRVQQQQTP